MPFHTADEQRRNTTFTRDIFENDPLFATQAFAPQRGVNFQGQGRNFFDFFTPGGLQNRFNVQQAQRARRGEPPDLEFVDFLADFPFINEFLSASPQARGIQNTSRFAPPARWLIPR